MQKEFSYLFSNILHVFNFLKTGNVEASYQDSKKFSPAEILEDTSLDNRQDTTETLDIATILRMLVIIHGRFKDTLLFSKQGLSRIPYIFDSKNVINCNFDESNNFQIITTKEIEIEAFTSCRIKFHFSCFVKQLIIFEPTEIIQGLQSDVASQLPPFYDFQEVILHNFKNEMIIIPPNAHIGSLCIKSFSEKTIFIP